MEVIKASHGELPTATRHAKLCISNTEAVLSNFYTKRDLNMIHDLISDYLEETYPERTVTDWSFDLIVDYTYTSE